MLGKAIVSALKALAWVILLFLIVTYLFAILFTEMIGTPNNFSVIPDENIAEWFGSMTSAMFTLVQLTTLEDWAKITRYVTANIPEDSLLPGEFWRYVLMAYVLSTNWIIMNVVLATLIENLILLNEEVKEAREGGDVTVESWMLTPSDLQSTESEDLEEQKEEEEKKAQEQGGGSGPQQSAADRLALQTLSEFFDLSAEYVGIEGQNHRKLVTQKSLAEALQRTDVQTKLYQACPALQGVEAEEMAGRIWDACPKKLDKDGMSRQELAEACMVMRGELSLNHFVIISQALQKMEKHIDHELVHLNKHQRKMNRRFLKLRHRLRKVYHFDGAPRKMIELVEDIRKKKIQEEARKLLGGGAQGAASLANAGKGGDAPDAGKDAAADDDSIALSSDDEDDEGPW